MARWHDAEDIMSQSESRASKEKMAKETEIRNHPDPSFEAELENVAQEIMALRDVISAFEEKLQPFLLPSFDRPMGDSESTPSAPMSYLRAELSLVAPRIASTRQDLVDLLCRVDR